IKGHYIVLPASGVLLPPSLTSVVNRYPYNVNNIVGSAVAGAFIHDDMVRASRILVSVFNVNGKGHSFEYEAELVGVDGAGDIAILRIACQNQFNTPSNPKIEDCHPVLKLGNSRASKNGEKIYLLSHKQISEGLLSDHRYLENSGWQLAESVLVSATNYA